MNLKEQIYRIQGLMVTEGKEGVIKSMIEKHGLYHFIKLISGFDYSIEDYISKEDKITFIKEIVVQLCEKYDDVEVAQYNLNGNQIQYGEEDGEKQMIEYYRPEFVIVERYKYVEEPDDDDDDDDDYYLGAFEVPYEELSNSLINEIFHLMLEEI